jgi:hypothetical protein
MPSAASFLLVVGLALLVPACHSAAALLPNGLDGWTPHMWRTQGRRYIDKLKTENALRRDAIADEVSKAMRLRRSLAAREKRLENQVDERSALTETEVHALRERLQNDERQLNRSASPPPPAVAAAAASVSKAAASIPSKAFKELDKKLKTLVADKQLLDADLLTQVADYAASFGMVADYAPSSISKRRGRCARPPTQMTRRL